MKSKADIRENTDTYALKQKSENRRITGQFLDTMNQFIEMNAKQNFLVAGLMHISEGHNVNISIMLL